jgi:peptidoglycan/LPS O-acetylase OafA/YrhL
MTPNPRSAAVPLVDWAKALASQLIVWHHLAWYGPMAVAAGVLAPDLLDWLRGSARLAVQVFLVLGGFLAARSLMPTAWHVAGPQPSEVPRLLAQRYWRLAKPCLVALALALVSAALARSLINDPDTPELPDLAQLLANVLFLQDVLGVPALSAGLWYVAIDLQLFALLLGLAVLRRLGRRGSTWNRIARHASLLGLITLTAVSLLWLNLMPELDAWAPYFFGAYGLGVLAQWIQLQPRRGGLLLALAALVLLALFVEWRSRIALAGSMALLLAWQPGRLALASHVLHPLMRWLARTSYAVFLVHYPVLLAVEAVVDRAWPDELLPNTLGLFAAWALSLTAGWLLHRSMEQAPPRAAAPALAKTPWAGQRG